MSTSYDGTILDHLAKHMLYLSTASLFWFSLDSSYDHEFHLSQQLGMSPQAYEYLLVAANLAHFHTKWGFSIKKRKWDLFIEGHQFSSRHCMGTFEIDSKTIDLNSFINGVSPVHRVRRQFIRIGIINDYSLRKIEIQKDSDGQMMVIPPRLNGLLLRQQSLRKLMDPFYGTTFLRKGWMKICCRC